jgi:hypothetical protein
MGKMKEKERGRKKGRKRSRLGAEVGERWGLLRDSKRNHFHITNGLIERTNNESRKKKQKIRESKGTEQTGRKKGSTHRLFESQERLARIIGEELKDGDGVRAIGHHEKDHFILCISVHALTERLSGSGSSRLLLVLVVGFFVVLVIIIIIFVTVTVVFFLVLRRRRRRRGRRRRSRIEG